MKELNNNKIGMIVGSFFGLAHLTWSLVVAFGMGQAYLDYVIGLHFLNNPFQVTRFDPGKAVMLVLITSVVGYVIGWVFSALWNYFHR